MKTLNNMGVFDGIVGSGLGALANIYTNNKNIEYQQQANEQNIQLQRDINQQNLDQQWKMWNATNEYNSPAAQMARYRDAGLNPNLIYGQSNTAQSMNVGTASAPQVQAKKVDYNQLASVASSYMSLISQKKSIERQQLENDLMARTLEDKITQSGITTRQMILNTYRTSAEINKIGVESYVHQLDSQMKEFELSLNGLRKNLLESEVNIKNNQSAQSAVELERSKAQLKVEQFQINIEIAKHTLLEAQTEHELQKIGVTQQQKDILLKQLDKMDVDIASTYKSMEKTDAEISNLAVMSDYYEGKNKRERVNTIVDTVDKTAGIFGKIGSGLRTFKFLKLIK